MDLSPILIAIPIFFLLMAIELIYEGITNKKTYRVNDALSNINAGVLQQMSGTFLVFFKIGILILVYEYLAPFHLPRNWWTFAAVMILWDLCYYWEHRMAHRVSLFWGGHSVHHQSEDYNLSVALRQTSTGFLWGTPFFVPLALMGFDPKQIVIAGGLNLLYQFWIHTEHIDKLPNWFEYIFNTPSHHRVHHGRNPKYIDKNYGGILIIWDRMFGSFAQEEERPTYGVTKPLASWNPVYANFAHYIDLAGVLKKTRSFKDALFVLFKPPGWMPDYLGGYQAPPEVEANYQKFTTKSPLSINVYILIQFFIFLAFNLYFLFYHKTFSFEFKVIFALWIVWNTAMFGFLFETRSKVVVFFEVLRLVSLPVLLWSIL